MGNITFEAQGISAPVTDAEWPVALGFANNGSKGLLPFPTAATCMLKKIKTNVGDVVVLVISDSTGNEQTEFVYLLSVWYGQQHPTHTVYYHMWNDASDSYDTAIEIATGTGPNAIHVYNTAVSGSSPNHLMGSKYQSAIVSIPKADLIICNHGHNMNMGVDDTFTDKRRVPRFLGPIGSVIRTHSGAGLIFVAQNPNRDNDTMGYIVNAVYTVAGLLNADVADVHRLFLDQGKATELYLDDKHPSSSGTQLFLSALQAVHMESVSPKIAVSPFDIAIKNLLPNGEFLNLTGEIPDGFSSNGTISSDATLPYGEKGYSIKVSGNNSSLTYTLPAELRNELIGSWVTLAVAVYQPDTSPSTSGRIAINTNLDSANTSVATTSGNGDWRWEVMSAFIAPGTTYIQVRVFGDTGSSGGECNFGRAVLVKGRLPSDA